MPEDQFFALIFIALVFTLRIAIELDLMIDLDDGMLFALECLGMVKQIPIHPTTYTSYYLKLPLWEYTTYTLLLFIAYAMRE